ncbi:hypothetical protein Tco_0792454 [Tanacetum coccineum]
MPLIREENTIVSGPDLFSQSDYYPENKAVNEQNHPIFLQQVAHAKPHSAPHEVVEKYQLAISFEYRLKCRKHSVLKSLTLILGGGDANRGITDYGIQLCFCFPDANIYSVFFLAIDKTFVEQPCTLTDYIGCLTRVNNVRTLGNANTSQTIIKKLDIENLNGDVVELTLRDEIARTFAKDLYDQMERPVFIAVPSRTSTVYFEVALEEADNNRRRKEPDEPKDAPTGRDVFNENPSHDELMAVSEIAKPVTTSLARMCKYQNPHQNSESEKAGILVLNCYAKNWLSDVMSFGDIKEEVAAKRKDKIVDSEHGEVREVTSFVKRFVSLVLRTT